MVAVEVGDRKFDSASAREFWRWIKPRVGAVVVIGGARTAAVEQYVTESYEDVAAELRYHDGVFVELHIVASIAPGDPANAVADRFAYDPPLRRLFPTSAIVLVRPASDRDDVGGDDDAEPRGENDEPVPFIRYNCETVENATVVNDAVFRPDGAINDSEAETHTVPAGGIVCEVYTNDNDDDGSMRSPASWTIGFPDRDLFDRVVGKSGQGAISRRIVNLDGERVE